MKINEGEYWTGNEIQKEGDKVVGCSCGATKKSNESEARFLKRHPRLCSLHTAFHMRLGSGTRSVDGDETTKRTDRLHKDILDSVIRTRGQR